MRYSQELKEAILRRILPPNNESIAKVAREEGLPEQTIRSWQKKARANGTTVPAKDSKRLQNKASTNISSHLLNYPQIKPELFMA